MRRFRIRESALQESIVELLRYRARPGVLWFSVPNEGQRSEREGARLKRMGMKPGVADMAVIIDGAAHFLELKAKGGRQSHDQELFQMECDIAGVPYRLASSFDAAEAILSEWGVFVERRREAA